MTRFDDGDDDGASEKQPLLSNEASQQQHQAQRPQHQSSSRSHRRRQASITSASGVSSTGSGVYYTIADSDAGEHTQQQGQVAGSIQYAQDQGTLPDGGGHGDGDGDGDAPEEPEDQEPGWTVTGELKKTLLLSLPIFVAVCSWLGMKVTDTAVLGHVGTDYLSAASLSDIYTTSTQFLIGGRVLSTFCGQAWGAKNYRLVGIWLNVSLVIVGLLCIPVIVSWNLTTYVLKAFKKTGEINHNASLYSRILSVSLPAQVLFSQTSAFFQAQQIVRPGVVVAVTAFVYNLLMNLFLVLGVGIKHFDGVGFIGCPSVTSSAQYLQLFLLFGIYIFWKKLHRKAWYGFHWHEVTWKRCKAYLRLYLPAILMYGSEFWRFNLIGVLAASLSDTDVAAFNASYKVTSHACAARACVRGGSLKQRE